MGRRLTLLLYACYFYSCHPVEKRETLEILNGHPMSFYLTHAGIPKVYKDLFTGTIPPSDDPVVLSLLDSVFTLNDETRPFYLLTVTRTIDLADGAYAEPLGAMAKEFAETRSEDFVDFFYSNHSLGDQNLDQWARIVAGEIRIAAEGEEAQELRMLENRMKMSCERCNDDQREIANEFVDRVRNHLP